jgi:hypothetical protein
MNDISREPTSTTIMVKRIGELGALAVTNNRSKQRRILPESLGAPSQSTAFFMIDYFHNQRPPNGIVLMQIAGTWVAGYCHVIE